MFNCYAIPVIITHVNNFEKTVLEDARILTYEAKPSSDIPEVRIALIIVFVSSASSASGKIGFSYHEEVQETEAFESKTIQWETISGSP